MQEIPFLVFYIFGDFSIILSLWVVWSLRVLGMNNALSMLVMYLQVTLLFQEILSFPQIFLVPIELCQVAAGLKQYFTLSNLIVNCFMSYSTYSMIFSTSNDRFSLSRVAHASIIILPVVMLVPLFAYGADDTNTWCTFQSTQTGRNWGITSISLACLFNIPAVVINILVIIRLARHGQPTFSLLVRVVRGSSIYCFVTVGLWIPKIFTINFGSVNDLNIALATERFCTFFAGIAYFLIYILERVNLHAFEKEVQSYRNSSTGIQNLDESLNSRLSDFDGQSIGNKSVNVFGLTDSMSLDRSLLANNSFRSGDDL